MGSRLGFTVDVPSALAAHPFPPNLLVSLVENAIKHGIEPSAGGGTVAVRARQEGKLLFVTVEDTGLGLRRSTRAAGGVGLSNVRDRLAALYGTQGQFSIERGDPAGTRATLAIPLESDASDAAPASRAREAGTTSTPIR